ncbi:MAG: DUF6398 domain-containing protein [Planctomycetota bacterium]
MTTARVPKKMQPLFEEIAALTDAFCRQHLNEEYVEVCRRILTDLCCLRDSPLASGNAKGWAAGVVRSAGYVNFLADKAQKPHMATDQLCKLWGVGQSTVSAKHAAIRKALDLMPFYPPYSLKSNLANNPMVWMITVNGLMMDARTAPREIQEEAFRKGVIPYIPEPPQEKPKPAGKIIPLRPTPPEKPKAAEANGPTLF